MDANTRAETLEESLFTVLAVLKSLDHMSAFAAVPPNPDDRELHNDGVRMLAMLQDWVKADLGKLK